MGTSVKSRPAVLLWALVTAAFTAAPLHDVAAAAQQGLEGSWAAEQSSADNGGVKDITLSFDRSGAALSGTMRAADSEMPLFDVRETGATISFTVVIPGTPYVS